MFLKVVTVGLILLLFVLTSIAFGVFENKGLAALKTGPTKAEAKKYFNLAALCCLTRSSIWCAWFVIGAYFVGDMPQLLVYVFGIATASDALTALYTLEKSRQI